ncbi:hypothetical protein TSUD_15790 [Trifolium subterraneum]|uniref:Replication factor A C-terminal domain-containing protein n=1 Tax=Trifolium subterraneum TaxID=3900 RepID=A0A2Z6MXT1_TRISU|nr:hypothetical protein TSUD_15790 [Trifolium subterraneum]
MINIVCMLYSLDAAIETGTFAPNLDTMSQLVTQSSGGSQYTPEQKICHKHEIMPLSNMIFLTMDTQVVTVVKTVCVKTNKNGWYFQACVHCPKATGGEKPPHFTFWDRECEQLLGTSAADLRAETIAAGITDPCFYPVVIDKIEGRTLACKVKWQQKWKTASVNQDSKAISNHSQTVIKDITSSQADDKDVDIVIPTISLSDEIDPDHTSMITPSKRTGPSVTSDSQNDEYNDLIGSKLSSTKLTKHAEKE